MPPESSSSAEEPLQPPLPVVDQPDALRLHLSDASQQGQRVGFVPTMGALHAGHRSLIETARAECNVVVVSIFVNPLQFGPHEDFEKYPRPLERDVEICRENGVDIIFHPTREVLYPPGFDTAVEVGQLSTIWEGRHRPGHFRGVTTVVLKLLNIVQADVAYFGQKDYQQQAIIRRMCEDLHVPTEIRTCPTVRDEDGLALSSRNQYLSAGERRSALALSQSLNLAREKLSAGESDLAAIRTAMRDLLASTENVEPDYATIADPHSLVELSAPQPRMVAMVAAQVGPARLIDNQLIDLPR